MKVLKDKYKVTIMCLDGSVIKGTVHVSEGLRIHDFLNDIKESFIAVTEVEFSNIKELRPFKVYARQREKEDIIFLNKASIKVLEEVKQDGQ